MIAAPADAVAEVICDFPRYPEWIKDMKSTEVLEEFEDGYAHLVRFDLDAGVFKDVYQLRYEYSQDIRRISWVLDTPSSVQKSQVGSYDLAERSDGETTVTYTLAVELSIPMLGMFKRKAEKMIMDSALKDLKKRVEESA
jgi:uncharacterized membrane protein